MNQSENLDKLAVALAVAQGVIKNAAFDKVNPHFKSKYATLAGVRDTITPSLSENGLSIIQGVSIDDGGYVLTTRLLHSSGQWIESVYPFSVGKPQEMGSAMTYARRYSLSAICNIASEEDDDGNEGQNGATPNPPPAKTTPKAQSREPYEKISAGINAISEAGTQDDLMAWYRSHVKTIDAFPPDWNASIMEEFTAAKDALEARAA